MLDQVAVVLACWQKDEIAPQYSDVLEILRRGLLDPAQSVRSASRDAFCSLAALWYVCVGVVWVWLLCWRHRVVASCVYRLFLSLTHLCIHAATTGRSVWTSSWTFRPRLHKKSC